jgi:uncharacterized protein DUF6766
MRRFFRENSLSIVMFGLFFAFLAAQSVAGHREYNNDQREHGEPVADYVEYLRTGHFVEAVFENWESEFLQMGSFVLFTIFLRQKGSPESKKLEGKDPVDADARDSKRRRAPWPVRRGRLALAIYENSLTIALFMLFFMSLFLHAAGGASEYSQEQMAHGGQPVSLLAYMGTSRFWFESFQNWQSEYLSVGVLVVLAIFLRQRGSPESKPVDHPNDETGSE